VELPKVYLAGPDVFLPNALEKAEELRAICHEVGLEGRFPLDVELGLGGLHKPEQGLAISRANEALIHSCDGVLANMTPFRGPSTDVGTAFEIGFARALGKPIVGYTESNERYLDRTVDFFGAAGVCRRADGTAVDPAGMKIEDFELVDNLMLDGAVVQSGGRVIRPADVPESGVSVFEWAARTLATLLREE
jgi:nucleoside 2-deoxyribosyltransferase